MSEPIRIVLVGCGSIAQLAHLPALRRLSEQAQFTICGVCDADPSRAEEVARKFGAPQFGTQWREVARQARAEAVSLCLPPGPNADIAVAALEQGFHVLCEKPPGRNLAQAQAMAAAARAQSSRVSRIAFNRRHAPLYARAMERSRRFGPPQAFYGRFTRPAMGQEPSNTASDWISSDGSHALDLAIATMGRPNRVSIMRQRAGGAGPDNIWTLHLVSERGGAVLLLGFAAGRRLERFEWTGPGYDVVLELPERGEWCAPGTEPETWVSSAITGSSEFDINYGFMAEYEAFGRAIRGQVEEAPADFAYGEFFMRVVEGVLKARAGETVSWDEAPDGPETVHALKAMSRRTRESSRRVVSILQPMSAQSRYFSTERLSELSALAEIRPVSMDNGCPSPLADATVVLAGWGASAIPRELLEKASGLELIVVLGASVKWALPMDLVRERGVPVCTTADAIAQSVAEHCLLLSLAGLRRLTDIDARMRRGEWPPRGSGWSLATLAKRARKLPGMELFKPLLKPVAGQTYQRVLAGAAKSGWQDLRGQTVGLVGWGHIARRFAELLEPFGCSILVHSEHARPEILQRYGARLASLGEVLGASRIVSLHKGETEKTRGMIGQEELSLLQKGTVVVNTARASLIREDALIERARRGDIVFALDVFHKEPLASRHPLRRLNNVILTPHSASSTSQCGLRVGDEALRIVRAFLQGEDIQPLSEEQLATMS